MGIVSKCFPIRECFKVCELGTDPSVLGRAEGESFCWGASLQQISCKSGLLVVFAGLLQKDPGLPLDPGMEEDGLFCCPDDPFHIPH